MRSTKLMALCLALLAALMLVAAGCGSSSKSSAGDTEAATTEAATTEAATTEEATTEAATTEAATTEAATTEATTTNALGGIASASNCKELQDLGSKLSTALSGTGAQTAANIKKEAEVLNDFADKAPAEIKDDFKTMAAFVSKAADIYGNVSPGKVPDASTLQKIQGLQKDAAKVTTASQNIAAWAGKNCHA